MAIERDPPVDLLRASSRIFEFDGQLRRLTPSEFDLRIERVLVEYSRSPSISSTGFNDLNTPLSIRSSATRQSVLSIVPLRTPSTRLISSAAHASCRACSSAVLASSRLASNFAATNSRSSSRSSSASFRIHSSRVAYVEFNTGALVSTPEPSASDATHLSREACGEPAPIPTSAGVGASARAAAGVDPSRTMRGHDSADPGARCVFDR